MAFVTDKYSRIIRVAKSAELVPELYEINFYNDGYHPPRIGLSEVISPTGNIFANFNYANTANPNITAVREPLINYNTQSFTQAKYGFVDSIFKHIDRLYDYQNHELISRYFTFLTSKFFTFNGEVSPNREGFQFPLTRFLGIAGIKRKQTIEEPQYADLGCQYHYDVTLVYLDSDPEYGDDLPTPNILIVVSLIDLFLNATVVGSGIFEGEYYDIYDVPTSTAFNLREIVTYELEYFLEGFSGPKGIQTYWAGEYYAIFLDMFFGILVVTKHKEVIDINEITTIQYVENSYTQTASYKIYEGFMENIQVVGDPEDEIYTATANFTGIFRGQLAIKQRFIYIAGNNIYNDDTYTKGICTNDETSLPYYKYLNTAWQNNQLLHNGMHLFTENNVTLPFDCINDTIDANFIPILYTHTPITIGGSITTVADARFPESSCYVDIKAYASNAKAVYQQGINDPLNKQISINNLAVVQSSQSYNESEAPAITLMNSHADLVDQYNASPNPIIIQDIKEAFKTFKDFHYNILINNFASRDLIEVLIRGSSHIII